VDIPAGEEVLGRRREHDLRLRADPVGDRSEYLRVETEHADGVPAEHPAGLVGRHLVSAKRGLQVVLRAAVPHALVVRVIDADHHLVDADLVAERDLSRGEQGRAQVHLPAKYSDGRCLITSRMSWRR